MYKFVPWIVGGCAMIAILVGAYTLSYMTKAPSVSTSPQIETSGTTASPSTSSARLPVTEIPFCNAGDGLQYVTTDVTHWITSTGTSDLYFRTIHPQSVSIHREEKHSNEGDTYRISDSSTGYSASMTVSAFTGKNFVFAEKYYGATTIHYELFSDTFWESDPYNSYPEQCLPSQQNIAGRNYIFVTPSGATGYMLTGYHVILRPTEEKYEAYNCNRPIGIHIQYSDDGNSEVFASEKYKEFGSMIETMIKHMEIRPYCKG